MNRSESRILSKACCKAWIAASLFTFSTGAFGAAAFELTDGKEREVCRSYHDSLSAYLRSLPEWVLDEEVAVRSRIACDTKASHERIVRPRWDGIPVVARADLVARVYEYLDGPPLNEAGTIPGRRFTAENPLGLGADVLAALNLQFAEIDLDNDGDTDPILRFGNDGRCRDFSEWRWPTGWAMTLLVLSPNRETVDVIRTAPFMQNPNKIYIANQEEIDATARQPRAGGPARYIDRVYRYSENAPGEYDFRSYDTFRFDNKTYFDRWVAARNANNLNHMTVFLAKGREAVAQCEFVLRTYAASQRR